MPLFHHDRDEAAPEPPPAADPSLWQSQLARWSGLAFTERAAELMTQVAPDLDGSGNSAPDLLAPLLPALHSMDLQLSDAEFGAAVELEAVLHDALQALYLGRLVRRIEGFYKGATAVTYRISADGSAALAAGDVAAVLARRLPD